MLRRALIERCALKMLGRDVRRVRGDASFLDSTWHALHDQQQSGPWYSTQHRASEPRQLSNDFGMEGGKMAPAGMMCATPGSVIASSGLAQRSVALANIQNPHTYAHPDARGLNFLMKMICATGSTWRSQCDTFHVGRGVHMRANAR